jgi:ATP-dependent RNA helicase RhlE
MSSQSFADLGLTPAVRDALAEQGIHKPFPIQELVIGDALVGCDLLVKSPTGSGKTLAFAAPLVERIEADQRRPAALVVAPTRELALQILDELRPLARARALSATAVYGGAGIAKQAKLASRSHILVATPGRLLDLIGRGAVSLATVGILVLDEADRMLDMGFRPDVDRIVAGTPADRQTLLFSATLDEHRFVGVSHGGKLPALVDALRDERELALVFVRTKRGADRLVKRLGAKGVEAAAMHGNKSQSQRERALARFDKGHVDALVATDVAARGIDVDGISHVINFDPPGDSDAYLHRVGRTARAGRGGVGVTFVKPEEATEVGAIARRLNLGSEFAAAGVGGSSGAAGTRRRQRRPSHPVGKRPRREAQGTGRRRRRK